VLIAIGNSGDVALANEAEQLLDDSSPLIRGAAVWALGRLDRGRLERCAACNGGETDPDVIAEWTAATAMSD
jgi:epoxyqueuosine reductase